MITTLKTTIAALATSIILATSAFAGELIFNSDTSDPAPKAAFEAMIAGFEAENPDIKVTWNLFDHEGYKTSSRNALTADVPDVASWHAGTLATGCCPNFVRYEVMKHFNLFVTESSEHFAEYVPWFIKSHRPDLIEQFQIPLDEYPLRCEEQVAEWVTQAEALHTASTIEVAKSHEYAATIMNSITDSPVT